MMGKAEEKTRSNTPGIEQGKIYNLTILFHLYDMCNKITAVLTFGFLAGYLLNQLCRVPSVSK